MILWVGRFSRIPALSTMLLERNYGPGNSAIVTFWKGWWVSEWSRDPELKGYIRDLQRIRWSKGHELNHLGWIVEHGARGQNFVPIFRKKFHGDFQDWFLSAKLLFRFQGGIWVFPKIMVPPNHPFYYYIISVFHYKPSILGYPYCWKHPYCPGFLEFPVLFSKFWV